MPNRLETFETLKKQYKHKAKGKQKERVADLLKLYKDEKIFSKITIQRELNRYLGQSFKNEDEREKHYFKTMLKYFGAQPSTEKRQEKRQEKRMEQKTRDIKTLFKVAEKRNASRYTVTAKLLSIVPQAGKKTQKIGGDMYYQISMRSFDVKAPSTFPDYIYQKYCRRDNSNID
jgi:hypothetical protein